MATLRFAGAGDWVDFTPISATLNNLPNGSGTLAALVRRTGGTDDDIVGLVNSTRTAWYHALEVLDAGSLLKDDDGITGPTAGSGATPTGTTANDFYIAVVDWPSGIATERFHFSATMGAAESWTHVNSTGNKGADRAGPGSTGRFMVADLLSVGALNGDVALIAAWPGVRFSDSDAQNLWINKKTSDWWNHPAGHPTLLSELTSTTPWDIGADPSTFAGIGTATLTGLDPTGWTFDGRGAASSGDDPPIGFLGRGAGW